MNPLAASAREVLRDVLIQTRAIEILRFIRGSPIQRLLKHASRRERFEAIYANGEWGGEDSEHAPGSGVGSSLDATTSIRRALPTLLDQLGVKSILDIGCGDFTWMQHILLRQTYIGIDIVPQIIVSNNAKYKNELRTFLLADGVIHSLPEAEAVLCREILFHLSLADVQRLLKNIQNSPRKYLIATTDTRILYNSHIETGDFHPLNLCISPFKFPKPDFTIDDSAIIKGRIIGVWNIGRIVNCLV